MSRIRGGLYYANENGWEDFFVSDTVTLADGVLWIWMEFMASREGWSSHSLDCDILGLKIPGIAIQ